MSRLVWILSLILMSATLGCKKESDENTPDPEWRYFEVGKETSNGQWRDTSYIVATKNAALLARIEAQLAKPVSERQIVAGALAAGSGGYNKNATHTFKWHIKEDDWDLVDMTVEIYDGNPYSDVDTDYHYWMTTVKRFAPWSSYIKREIVK